MTERSEQVDQQSQKAWSKEYCGISHFGELTDHRRATVRIICEDVIELALWIRGTFPPAVTEHTNLDSAKADGEKWANAI